MQVSLIDLGWLAAKMPREEQTPEAERVRRSVSRVSLAGGQHPVSPSDSDPGVAVRHFEDVGNGPYVKEITPDATGGPPPII